MRPLLKPLIFFLCALVFGCSETTPQEPTTIEFENFRVEEISATEAVVRFETSIPTSCDVLYGLASDALDQSESAIMDEPYAIVHEVWLTKLSPETMYFLRPSAVAEDGTSAQGDLDQFETLEETTMQARTNVAMMENGGSIASVSSNWSNAPNDGSFGANLAIDGNMGTEWSSNGDGNDAEISVQFTETDVTGFSFRSRKMTDGTSIIERFELFDADGSSLGTFDSPNPDETYEFVFDAPVTTNTIRLDAIQTTGGNTGVKELMIWD